MTKSLYFCYAKKKKQTVMIPFKEITLADKEVIQAYTFGSCRRNCDLSFANLYSWRFLYHTVYAEWNGFLLFRFYAGKERVYMMPVGTGDLKAVLEAMTEEAREAGEPFRMLGVCAGMKGEIEEAMPGRFDFSADRDYFDYLYLRTDLATLKGRKYQPKRNHIHRFKNAYPDYEYKELVPELVPECLKLEAEWCRTNNAAEDMALQAERRSMTVALGHFEELGLRGGVLHVGGEIVAFTFGMPVNGETFDVCVEKANTDIEGAYAVINNEFALRIPEQYTYVNREEDLGLEGLRKAKLSYHPAILLEKYMARLKD